MMSFTDDTCDFCHSRFDPMGNDLARVVGDNYWCGQCRQGRDAQFGDLSLDEVIAMRDKLQREYDDDPIVWERPMSSVVETRREEYKAHAQRLYRLDYVSILRQVFKDRENPV